jgi:Uma2 family endonuclease
MGTTRTLTTEEDLFGMPDDGFRYELVKGVLYRMPLEGGEHGVLSMKLGIAVGQFVKANDLGVVVSGDTGFRIASDPDTVRAPDVAFVRRDRIPEGGLPRGFWPGAPDLAVEVISPSDAYTDVEEKVGDWLEAGTHMVILINPRTRTVTVYSSLTDVSRLTESGVLTFGDVIPGFTYQVSELFV